MRRAHRHLEGRTVFGFGRAGSSGEGNSKNSRRVKASCPSIVRRTMPGGAAMSIASGSGQRLHGRSD